MSWVPAVRKTIGSTAGGRLAKESAWWMRAAWERWELEMKMEGGVSGERRRVRMGPWREWKRRRIISISCREKRRKSSWDRKGRTEMAGGRGSLLLFPPEMRPRCLAVKKMERKEKTAMRGRDAHNAAVIASLRLLASLS